FPKREKTKNAFLIFLKRIKVYLLWAFSLIAFNVSTLSDAGYILSNMFKNLSVSSFVAQVKYLISVNVDPSTMFFLVFAASLFVGLIICYFFDKKSFRLYSEDKSFDNNPLALYKTKPRWLLYWLMGLLTAMFFLIANTGASVAAQFIYGGY
ncbi:MAG: hypothetical protein GX683_06355, partial [Ruminococcaceae bacterium]|nr:hypothetical protein [Oscillospiraceae bacterium]